LNAEVFDSYGIGISSFFVLLRALIKYFTIINFLVLPIVVIYSGNSDPKSLLTLGNFGFASVECQYQKRYLINEIPLKFDCKNGEIGKLINLGVMP
jgi:hypothetical protein